MSGNVLLFGDYILDIYRMCNATRICPEAPVPVLIENDTYHRAGGVALVANQLASLIGDRNVIAYYGSYSEKERIFAGSSLITRIDRDKMQWDMKITTGSVKQAIDISKPSAIIVSDYDKGAISKVVAEEIVYQGITKKIPIFVDAKNSWHMYKGAYAFFPNQLEFTTISRDHTIQKLGAKGCSVDDISVPLEKEVEVKDVTGAGDIFLAGFVAQFLQLRRARFVIGNDYRDTTKGELVYCAKFANRLAAESVGHLGTYVNSHVKPLLGINDFIDFQLDKQ